MTEQDILFSVDDKGIAVMTLNRPNTYNAINTNMAERLFPQLLREVEENNAIM